MTRFSICISPYYFTVDVLVISIQYHCLIYSTISSNTAVHCYQISVCTYILSLPIHKSSLGFFLFFQLLIGNLPTKLTSTTIINDMESGPPAHTAYLWSLLSFRLSFSNVQFLTDDGALLKILTLWHCRSKRTQFIMGSSDMRSLGFPLDLRATPAFLCEEYVPARIQTGLTGTVLPLLL